MSEFSGKCDFFDSVVAIHCDGDTGEKLEEFLARTDIYVLGKDGRDHKIEVNNEKDACKYYPYLESIAAFNLHEGRNCIHLASDSFIDQEEREHIGWHIRDGKKYWNRCKRNKTVPSVEEYLEQSYWSVDYLDRTIIERLIKDGNKAEFDDLHDWLHEHFRKKWYEEMIRVGYTEREAFDWVYKGFFTSEEERKERLSKVE